MKTLFYATIIVLLGLSFTSCSSTVDFTVHGRPGSIIYSPTNEQLATIDHDGKAKVKVDRKKFYPYLLSKSSNAEEPIPFALNYQGRSTFGHQVGVYTGVTVAAAGALAGAAGLISDGTESKIVLPGYAVMLAGLGPAAIIGTYLQTNTDVHHSFKYEKQQYTNENLSLDLLPQPNGNYRSNNGRTKNQQDVNKKDRKQTKKENKRTASQDSEVFFHTVKQGESIREIAEMYDVSVKDLIRWNNKKNNKVKAGEKIKIYFK